MEKRRTQRSASGWLWRMPWLVASAVGWTASVWIGSGPLAAILGVFGGIGLGLLAGWYYKRRRPSTGRLYAFIVAYCLLAATVLFIVAR
jgi:hypothetical protein